MMDFEQQLRMMDKYHINAEEAFLLQLLFLASIDEQRPEYLKQYCSISKLIGVSVRDLILSLQRKGVINKSYKVAGEGQRFDPEAIDFNKTFLKNYRKFSLELGKEFLEVYPKIGIINGQEVNLQNYGKKFDSEADFSFCYGKAIGWDLTVHQQVLDLVNWAKENACNLLTVNVSDFVISKLWRGIEELKNGGGAITFDSIISV